MLTQTPLRYPGGKTKLYKFLELVLQTNYSAKASYAEPYAGGAGLAMSLLLKGKVSDVYINDINRSVFAFWRSVLFETDMLIEKIHRTSITMDEWYRQQEVQAHKNDAELLDLGFSTFFLNRTNRSGILKGGVIGGKNQDGVWKLDARFNKDSLIERIKRIAEKRDNIHLFGMDACKFLDHMQKTKIGNIFYYLDPPYIKKGSDLYENYYSKDDHTALAKQVKSLKAKWMISYDAHELAAKLYGKYNNIIYDLSYSAQDKKLGQEFMAFSNKLQIPEIITSAQPGDRVFNMSNIVFNPRGVK